MFHLVQFLFQTVLQPLWDSTWRLYERFIAFFNGVVVPMKLAHVCDHVMKFFQKVFLCEVIGGTSNCILQDFLVSVALEGNPFVQSNPTSHRLAVLRWEVPLSSQHRSRTCRHVGWLCKLGTICFQTNIG